MKIGRFHIVRDSTSKKGVRYAICPLCADKSGHVEIDFMKGVWHCHRCKRGGALELDQQYRPERPVMRKPVPRVDSASFFPVVGNGRFWEYLVCKRKLPERLVYEMEPHSLRGDHTRVYFPLYHLQREVCGWIGRTMSPLEHPKWKFIGKAHDRCFFWGLHNIRPEWDIVLVEGVFDAVWDQHRLAVFGTHLTRDAMTELAQISPKTITFMFDADAIEKQYTCALELASRLSVPVFLYEVPKGKDPGDLGWEGRAMMMKGKRRLA
jgi:hypothetical protein